MNDIASRTCPSCGRALAPGERRCPSCQPFLALGPAREPALIAVLALLALLFAATTAATRFHTRGQAELAEEWYERGAKALDAGLPEEAIEHFRTALVYSRDNRVFRFRLAQALEAAGHRREARAYLLQLWENEPGSGPINLHLARLAAGEGDAQGAVRYYQNAIYGFWERDPEGERRQVRFELVDFLLSRRFREAALAELLALAGDLPNDAAVLVRVGEQFLQAGAMEPALETFERALTIDSSNIDALAGMGRIAFQRADYRAARRYLAMAAVDRPGREELAGMLETSDMVLAIDPFDRRIGAAARRSRVIQAYGQAWTRLMGCMPAGPLERDALPREDDLTPLFEEMRALETKANDRALRQDPDLLDTVMDVVFAVEEATNRVCGPPTGLDRALLLIGRRAMGTGS